MSDPEQSVNEAAWALWDENNRQILDAFALMDELPIEVREQLEPFFDNLYNTYKSVVDHLSPVLDVGVTGSYRQALQQALANLHTTPASGPNDSDSPVPMDLDARTTGRPYRTHRTRAHKRKRAQRKRAHKHT